MGSATNKIRSASRPELLSRFGLVCRRQVVGFQTWKCRIKLCSIAYLTRRGRKNHESISSSRGGKIIQKFGSISPVYRYARHLFLIFSSTVRFDDAAMQKAFIQSYMLTMTGFSMSGFALFTFPMMLAEDRKNSWLTFIQHSPLPIWHYYLSKLVRVLLCFVSSIAVVFAVGGLVKGRFVSSGMGRVRTHTPCNFYRISSYRLALGANPV